MQRMLVLALLLCAPAFAANPAAIEDAAFLEGVWQGEALGGWCEEIWSAARAGAMMGVFRLIDGEKTRFYEIMQLVEEEGGLRLRIKHFSDAFAGWEEKDKSTEFPFLRSAPGLLEFEGIVFRRLDDDHVTITVAIHQEDGSARNVDFAYRRAKE